MLAVLFATSVVDKAFTESAGLYARLNAFEIGTSCLPHDPVKALRRSVASIECDSRLTTADADLADFGDSVHTC
jgi:hypothetical protein